MTTTIRKIDVIVAITLLSIFVPTPAYAYPFVRCNVNFPTADEPCAAITTAHKCTCMPHHIADGLCDTIGEIFTCIWGVSPNDEWPYWTTNWETLNQIPEWPSCLQACMDIAPPWPQFAECCPSGPAIVPPSNHIFSDGFESGDTSRWSVTIGG